ncbi:hypothetical protein [Paenibacillus xylanexedens]|uniref:hypothetical protein n=1 Tax=Paenibacillus xylanexedens TaxID=528191 RepID=UPI001642CA92|nr:hypothetical protein [Paenibacillus xylanexedens]
MNIKWDRYGKGILPVIIPMVGVIIFNTFNLLLKGIVTLTEESYSLGYKLGLLIDNLL